MQAEARPAEPPSHSLTAGDDATAARSRETADVLDAARLNVALVMERATKEAAELLAAAEHEAQEKAAQQSTAALAAAEAHAKEMLDGAEAELAQVTARLEHGQAELAELTALRETLRTQFSDTRATRRDRGDDGLRSRGRAARRSWVTAAARAPEPSN